MESNQIPPTQSLSEKELLVKIEQHLDYLHKITKKDHLIKTIHTVLHSIFLLFILIVTVGLPWYLFSILEQQITHVEGTVQEIVPDLDQLKDKVLDSVKFWD